MFVRGKEWIPSCSYSGPREQWSLSQQVFGKMWNSTLDRWLVHYKTNTFTLVCRTVPAQLHIRPREEPRGNPPNERENNAHSPLKRPELTFKPGICLLLGNSSKPEVMVPSCLNLTRASFLSYLFKCVSRFSELNFTATENNSNFSRCSHQSWTQKLLIITWFQAETQSYL